MALASSALKNLFFLRCFPPRQLQFWHGNVWIGRSEHEVIVTESSKTVSIFGNSPSVLVLFVQSWIMALTHLCGNLKVVQSFDVF